MKAKYEIPNIEIVELLGIDIIRTSGIECSYLEDEMTDEEGL